jgi:large subunit ribosomal protein L34
MKRTYQPSKIKRARTHGFRTRNSTLGGKKSTEQQKEKGEAFSNGLNGPQALHKFKRRF